MKRLFGCLSGIVIDIGGFLHRGPTSGLTEAVDPMRVCRGCMSCRAIRRKNIGPDAIEDVDDVVDVGLRKY
jgi:hypothetical protein